MVKLNLIDSNLDDECKTCTQLHLKDKQITLKMLIERIL